MSDTADTVSSVTYPFISSPSRTSIPQSQNQASSSGDFQELGIKTQNGKLQLTLDLSTHLQFEVGCPGKSTCPDDLDAKARAALRKIAATLGRKHVACTRIVIRGQSDSTRYVNDPFGNYDLSNRRASIVLRYLYKCEDCEPSFQKIRNKLTLAGVGDTLAHKGPGLGTDRTVNLVIDYAGDTNR
jgi:outer membrane protein OmpA-like peptidoglycan-associated protein